MTHRLFHRHPFVTRSPHNTGAVMIVMLFGLALMAGLLFYVLNSGRHIQKRTETQHAADVATMSAATQLARHLNTISQNHVGITRSLSLVNILDSLPEAVDFTQADQQALLDVTQLMLPESRQSPQTYRALNSFEFEVQSTLRHLRALDLVLNHSSFSMDETTYYNPQGSDRGWLWRGMLAMDQTNQAIAEDLNAPTFGGMIHFTGLSGGETHLSSEQGTIFAGPQLANWPLERGRFSDFERPLVSGLLPQAIDHTVIRRGPWDTVFGWRVPIGGVVFERSNQSYNPSQRQGTIPIGSSAGSGIRATGQWVREEPPSYYRVLGPQLFLLEAFEWMAERSEFRVSRLHRYVRTMANIKLDYFRQGGNSASRQTTIEPNWITDYSQARLIAANDPDSIQETLFIAVEVKSRYPRTDARFMREDDTWSYIWYWMPWTRDAWNDLNVSNFGVRLVAVNGWEDPESWNADKINSRTWRDEWTYEVSSDPDINVASVFLPQPDGTFLAVAPGRVYRIDEFIFVGINVGEPIEVDNPHNWSENDPDLPAPLAMTPEWNNPYDQIARSERMTILGLARQPAPAPFWTGRFDANKPQNHHLALAQARVFNNHSWDMWTPMWHAQLEPLSLSDMQSWISMTKASCSEMALSGDIHFVDQEAVREALDHLELVMPMAESMLTH